MVKVTGLKVKSHTARHACVAGRPAISLCGSLQRELTGVAMARERTQPKGSGAPVAVETGELARLETGKAVKKLKYLGSIDDKVVQYQSIKDPRHQFLYSLFFSVISGDPLVLNDGYLLHSDWGRNQLLDPQSALRQLNKKEHLLLVMRSSKPYSEWIPEQAERTESYRLLLRQLKAGELEGLDEAWKECVSQPWPALNLQVALLNLLKASADESLEGEIAKIKLEEHWKRFETRLERETVRSAWEGALLEMGTLDKRERSLMMEFASEAYHASFACGFAAGNDDTEVGIAGYGQRRLHSQRAYRQENGDALSSFLQTKKSLKTWARLEKSATVYVTRKESDLFNGPRLADFLSSAGEAKGAYRASLEQLLGSEASEHESVEALEHTLDRYRDVILGCFGLRRSRAELAELKLMDLADNLQEFIEKHPVQWALASNLANVVASSLVPGSWGAALEGVKDGMDITEKVLPPVLSLHTLVEANRLQDLHLLPQQRRGALESHQKHGYELSLDRIFVRRSTEGVPVFTPE
jgi:hypothetical protein